MSKRNDGGPAFPLPVTDQECCRRFESGYGGMTLRDYFAAKALQGICSSGPGMSWTEDLLACEAYRLADAMLKARETSHDNQ